MAPAAIQDPFLQRLVRKDTITAKKVAQKVKELMKVIWAFIFCPQHHKSLSLVRRCCLGTLCDLSWCSRCSQSFSSCSLHVQGCRGTPLLCCRRFM